MVPDDITALAASITGKRPVVLVDGGSGAGKTDLAAALAPLLGAEIVRLEDLYPGWDGLDAASRLVPSVIGGDRWRRWDWTSARLAEWHRFDSSRPLIVEGSGALSRANRSHATFGIWIELDEPTRKARALARDGDTYAPHWDRWAAQEKAFFAREQPHKLADVVVPG